jgi:hypothetical protein
VEGDVVKMIEEVRDVEGGRGRERKREREREREREWL